MALTVCRYPQLPRLSWFVAYLPGRGEAVLYCGDGVETRGDAWIDGAWSGRYEDFSFAGEYIAGTAGRLTDGRLQLYPAYYGSDAVYTLVKKDLVCASNSLAFLLSGGGTSLSLSYPYYLRDFFSFLSGLPFHNVVVPTADGEKVKVLRFLPAEIGPSGMSFMDLPAEPEFTTFQQYRDRLVEIVRTVAENAADEGRRTPYPLLAPISSGYDSAASTIIARDAGCRDTISLTHGRFKKDRSTADDSGAPLAARLGMSSSEFPREYALREGDNCYIAEFLATGLSGEDIVLQPFEPRLRNVVLVTGNHGDVIWDRREKPTTVLRTADGGLCSLTEFRLRLGFIHLPVPFLCARRHPSIHRITNSPEMKQWWLSGSYDRPIPRRIIEEAGIPRGSFATRNKAIVTHSYRSGFGDSYLDGLVAEFARENQLSAKCKLILKIKEVYERRLLYLLRNKLIAVLRMDPSKFRPAPTMNQHGLKGMLSFLWAVDRIAGERYSGIRRAAEEFAGSEDDGSYSCPEWSYPTGDTSS